MNIRSFETHLQSFWHVQIMGWMVYASFYFFHLLMFRNPDLMDIHRIAIIFVCGFIVTSLLRLVYHKIDYRACSLWFLCISVFLISFLAANVWFWASRFISLTTISGSTGFMKWLQGARFPNLIAPLFFDTILFVSWSALYFSIKIWIEWNHQREQAENSMFLAEKAQLQMLRYQLNPHFLFNTLNSIRALIIENKKAAKQMITELSEFLRYSLISKDFPIVPLKQEIEAIRQYLAIEKRRYEDKLEILIQMDSAATDYPILSFLIHPIVESAVRQGMRGDVMPLKINIQASVKKGALKVDVCSTGNWTPTKDDQTCDMSGPRNGLENVQRRLQTTCPESNLSVNQCENGAVCVQVEINKQMRVKNEKEIQYAHC
ncbi:histidine kinase [candidate division KSB1 bacterium]|nr:histidine kinase [candidate division KSB1 bacterium]